MRNSYRVAEAAAADADEPAPRVRAQIDAATEVCVVDESTLTDFADPVAELHPDHILI